MQRKVYLCSAVRTPIGDFGGAFKTLSATDLAVVAIKECLNRSNLTAQKVDFVIFGNCLGVLEQNIARIAAVNSGIPTSAPAYTISQVCTSSMQATVLAYQTIKANAAKTVIAGGTESMSNVPYALSSARWGTRLRHGQLTDPIWLGMQEDNVCGRMGEIAEELSAKYAVSRSDQDEFSLLSHQRAINAIKTNRLKEQIVSVTIMEKKDSKTIDTDEHPRENTSLEVLSKLQPVFRKDGVITAGNSSSLNDAAAAVILASEEAVRENGLEPMALIKECSVVAVDPNIFGYAPIPTINRLLEGQRLSLKDIDLFEIHEAFAVTYLVVERNLGLNRELVNVNGGSIALGHPTGATGCRLLVMLCHEMKRRGANLGIAAVCGGGGLGISILLENV